jgi:hypothetical protein
MTCIWSNISHRWTLGIDGCLPGLSLSKSYITSDGQSASLSWNKAPLWDYDQIFITVRQLRVCWCGALFLTRGQVCRLRLLLVLDSAVLFGSDSCGTRDHNLLSQIRDFPFHRLLRVAGLGWRYSIPLSHGSLQLPGLFWETSQQKVNRFRRSSRYLSTMSGYNNINLQ